MTVNVVSFLFSWCWGPLCWVLASFPASYQHLLWTPTHQSPKAPSAWCGFPYHISSITPSDLQLNCNCQLNCPLDHPLYLWNRMLDGRQAEIIVMQFRGHSLPVRQSMSVLWEFFTSSNFISQFPPTRFPLITAIRMCHFLPVHHLGMAFLAGSKAKIQHNFIELFVTQIIYCYMVSSISIPYY